MERERGLLTFLSFLIISSSQVGIGLEFVLAWSVLVILTGRRQELCINPIWIAIVGRKLPCTGFIVKARLSDVDLHGRLRLSGLLMRNLIVVSLGIVHRVGLMIDIRSLNLSELSIGLLMPPNFFVRVIPKAEASHDFFPKTQANNSKDNQPPYHK